MFTTHSLGPRATWARLAALGMQVGALCFTLGGWLPAADPQVRIKDITRVEGVRANTLTGMGLVTGLAGTGGKSPITRVFAQNFAQNFGIRADSLERLAIKNNAQEKTDNMSVVTVSAELPIDGRPGQTINCTVATFDDAKSLTGGELIMTPLYGADGQVYAVARGPVHVGAVTASGQAASVQKNHPTAGMVLGGAVIEKMVDCGIPVIDGRIHFLLAESNVTTATRIAAAINAKYPGHAEAVSTRSVEILVPPAMQHRISLFTAELGELQVVPDSPARVIVNARTGTIVIGKNVTISQVAIAHGNLAIITREQPVVSQPAPFSNGETTVVPRTEAEIVEEKKQLAVVGETTTVGDLAEALNSLGVTPRDMASIFEALKASGALHAELHME